MKVASVAPSINVNLDAKDLDLEVELANLDPPTDAPIDQEHSLTGDSTEGHDTQEGLDRLVDFMSQYKKKKLREKKRPLTFAERASSAYTSFDDLEDRLLTLGQNLNKRA